jgi:hypothetical protein
MQRGRAEAALNIGNATLKYNTRRRGLFRATDLPATPQKDHVFGWEL